MSNDIDETIEDFSNPSKPYLVFDNNKYSKHIELYEIINNNIKNKQYKQIFNMLSDNCILEYINKENNQSEYSKQELFEIYKKAAGIFNYKIFLLFFFLVLFVSVQVVLSFGLVLMVL